MKKYSRIIAIFMLALMLFGCSGKKTTTPVAPIPDTNVQPQTGETLFKNSLTGEYTLKTQDKLTLRPTAVMVNNQNDTRCHQIGLSKADIVYETYVEGGITRTLAIYKDIADVGEIGTIRSARYDFVDLACSNDATYVHAGVDPTYCQPYMNKLGLDDINLLASPYYGYTYRTENGHILEHTLYSTGEKINTMLKEKGWRMTVNESHAGDWQKFNAETKALSGGAANDITVTFSHDYVDYFKYDKTKGAYTKVDHRAGQKHKPAYTDSIDFKNVVVLFTTLGDMGNGYRVNVGLESGGGYYFSNGTYQEINWKKGSTYDSFKFTDKDGNELAYNPGNSWVCLVSGGMKNKFSFK